MRVHRLAIASLAIVGLTSCKGDSTGHPTGAVVPPLAYVRYFNAVSDTLPLDFRPIDQIEFSQPFLAVPFRAVGLGSYQGYQAGSRRIRVFPNSTDLATTSSILVDTSLTLNAGTYYSVMHVGYARTGQAPKQGLWVIEDPLPTPAGNIAVRVIHTGVDLGNVDVYITAGATDPLPATPTFANVSYKSSQTWVTRSAGAFTMRVFPAGTTATATITRAAPLKPATAISGNSYVGGADDPGTVFTAMLYSRAVAGSTAAVNSGTGVNTTPTVVFWIDKAPPGIAP